MAQTNLRNTVKTTSPNRDSSDSFAAKLPPQSVEAEQSVLGALLLDKDAVVKIVEILKPEHFYRPQHAIIYQAICRLYEKRLPADLITLAAQLKEVGEYDQVGGTSYISTLVSYVPTSANIEYYANIVKDKAVKRQLISASALIGEMSFDQDRDVKDLLDEAERRLFSISQSHLKQNFVSIKEALTESFDRLDELHKNKGGLRGVPTGFKEIDKKLSGLQPDNLLILAARPSVGKTTLAMNIAQNAAVKHKKKVGIFSLEVSKEQLVDLMLASQADVVGGVLVDFDHRIRLFIFGIDSIFDTFVFNDVIVGHDNTTTTKWLTPNGTWVHQQGIKPDIEVKRTDADFTAGKDPQLEAALKLFK